MPDWIYFAILISNLNIYSQYFEGQWHHTTPLTVVDPGFEVRGGGGFRIAPHEHFSWGHYKSIYLDFLGFRFAPPPWQFFLKPLSKSIGFRFSHTPLSTFSEATKKVYAPLSPIDVTNLIYLSFPPPPRAPPPPGSATAIPPNNIWTPPPPQAGHLGWPHTCSHYRVPTSGTNEGKLWKKFPAFAARKNQGIWILPYNFREFENSWKYQGIYFSELWKPQIKQMSWISTMSWNVNILFEHQFII